MMEPEDLAKSLMDLNLPLTLDEWNGLSKIFEQIQPGITSEILIKFNELEKREYANLCLLRRH